MAKTFNPHFPLPFSFHHMTPLPSPPAAGPPPPPPSTITPMDPRAAMAYYPYYGYYDFTPPIVDHKHERLHQHRSFLEHLTRHHSRPEDHPNQPDVDIRDALEEYLVEIEVPGIKNADDIHVTWINPRSLVVLGTTGRPEYDDVVLEKKTKIEEDESKKDEKDDKAATYAPSLLVGERRIGPFKRHFHLPFDVNREKMVAKLDAGLLVLRLPKMGHEKDMVERVEVKV